MNRRILLAVCLVGLPNSASYAQAVRAQPYNGQLRTDPAVGNVQGIQRYGRPLKTDPDEGEGFSYHVYPVAENPGMVVLGGGQAPIGPSFAQSTESIERLNTATKALEQALANSFNNKLNAAQKSSLQNTLTNLQGFPANQLLTTFQISAKKFPPFAQAWIAMDPSIKAPLLEYQQADQSRSGTAPTGMGPTTSAAGGNQPTSPGVFYLPSAGSPYPPPFDATAGIRIPQGPPPGASPALAALGYLGATGAPVGAGSSPYGFAADPLRQAIAYDPTNPDKPLQIYHQPLIQVRVRVIEVTRSDELQASSVLDVIGQPFGKKTLIGGNNVNHNNRNTYTGTRFAVPDNLVNFTGTGTDLSTITGSGMLVNLTTGNINYLARLLASEFHSNIVTAPEVVTLNGQNVEFVAGDKLPFALGQNVVTGNSANIQQFFYKHVGTFVSITPKIVNWGKLGDGKGKSPIEDSDVTDWQSFVLGVINLQQLPADPKTPKPVIKVLDYGKYTDEINNFAKFGGALSLDAKSQILDQLKSYAKSDLIALGLPVVDSHACGQGCEWHAQDCTIDLATVVRLSEGGTATLPNAVTVGGTPSNAGGMSSETNVRGIANIVQVKSGHGVVIGGLIGDREIKQIDKTPILGDIPLIGALFRSTQTQRQKTELLIFIEAKVLDPEPDAARCQSYQNFRYGAPFVSGEFLDNPLEYGMYRAGFGGYLPPCSPGEQIFWERLGRKVRRVSTEVDDIYK